VLEPLDVKHAIRREGEPAPRLPLPHGLLDRILISAPPGPTAPAALLQADLAALARICLDRSGASRKPPLGRPARQQQWKLPLDSHSHSCAHRLARPSLPGPRTARSTASAPGPSGHGRNNYLPRCHGETPARMRSAYRHGLRLAVLQPAGEQSGGGGPSITPSSQGWVATFSRLACPRRKIALHIATCLTARDCASWGAACIACAAGRAEQCREGLCRSAHAVMERVRRKERAVSAPRRRLSHGLSWRFGVGASQPSTAALASPEWGAAQPRGPR